MDDFLQEAPQKGVSCFFVVAYFTVLRRMPCTFLRGDCRSGLRGSALSAVNRQRWEAVFRRERRPASLDRFL